MLRLLGSPAWLVAGQAPVALPATLPAALLVVLGSRAQWLSRESLALIFWPDAAPADALHHLRVNLHRSRQLLESWGQGDALQSERTRLRLVLPTDVAQPPAPPDHWLQGWRLPGYEGFAEWCDDTAAALQREWLAAGATPGAAPPDADVPPGREAEHRRLLASPAPALLLLGEPGAGKTTLLRSAWPHAPCLRGLEGLHSMPYRPLLETLREHLPVLRRALREPAQPLRPYRLDLARVLPELAPDEPLPPLDALTAQTRLVEALARAFEALTPLLLVDDLQWCDGATVEWLLMLAHTGRLRWRAAARRHEISPPLAQSLQSLRSAVRLEEIDVPPLPRSGMAAACRRQRPELQPDADRLDRLHALSGGNPFLLGELIAVGWHEAEAATQTALPERVSRLLQQRLGSLAPTARRMVEAAAIFVQAVPVEALLALGGEPGEGLGAARQAIEAGLLHQDGDAWRCRHDLVREAAVAGLPPPRRSALHRHAALWLAERPDADPLTIAEHWRAAQEPQTALAWCHRGAEQLKSRGRFEEARALWTEVADESLDAAQALRARLELAACDLFEDLARGQARLEAVRAQLPAVADAEQRRQIEGRALAALVDNRVFAGDIAVAARHAARLRELLPLLPANDRIDAIEVLIELAMREPDIAGAWALLAQLREAAPRRPTLLSWEGQIHWFGGEVRAARDALARLLKRHPDYCRGITIENDLAVMLQALGEVEAAEAMARRSLESWAGVAHTETLSLLVLGLVLTSAGRHDEAEAALLRALALAREQGSAGFEAEALVRRARLQLQREDCAAAQAALDAAAPLLRDSSEPLRVSQWVLAQVLAASALARPMPGDAIARLQAVAGRSAHPLVHARLARVETEAAFVEDRPRDAVQAAARYAEVAQAGELNELRAEALLLQARARQATGEPAAAVRPLIESAADQARRNGYADVLRRAEVWLAANP
jgi:tetratricopeptide (TPR) repeat protein